MIDNDFKPTIHTKIIKGDEIFIDYEVLVKKIRNLETLIEDNDVEKVIKQLENIVEFTNLQKVHSMFLILQENFNIYEI